MKIHLKRLVDQANDYERPAAKIFKATLEYEADTALIAAKLADDIQFVCRAEDRHTASQVGEEADPAEKNSGFLHWVWMLVVDIARMAPPDHPLQDALVLALNILRQKEEIAPGAVSLQQCSQKEKCANFLDIGSPQVDRAARPRTRHVRQVGHQYASVLSFSHKPQLT